MTLGIDMGDGTSKKMVQNENVTQHLLYVESKEVSIMKVESRMVLMRD